MNALWWRICLAFACFTQFASGGFAQSRIATDPTEASVQAVARTALESFLNKIPPGREIDYGFRNRGEFELAIVGTPVRVLTLHPDSMRDGIDPKRSYMTPLNEWRVPVIIEGEFRTLLTVSIVNNALKAVELGGELLAREMMEFWENEPGGRKAMLRLYQLRCDFLVLDRDGSGMEYGEFYPFRSARLVFDGLRCSAANPCLKADMYKKIKSKYAEER
jgi:hypothetical protein